jgi:hypothetical protein
LKIVVKTSSPKSHLEVCSLIRFYESEILESELSEGEIYGYFILNTHPESIDSFILLAGVIVEWEK